MAKKILTDLDLVGVSRITNLPAPGAPTDAARLTDVEVSTANTLGAPIVINDPQPGEKLAFDTDSEGDGRWVNSGVLDGGFF